MQTDSKQLSHARELRKNMTRQERKLWFDFLRYHKAKFYKQKAFGPYIVDFYCPKAKLVIELDGSQHYEPTNMLYDQQRTNYLSGLGLTVVRYTNTDINCRLVAVCEDIDNHLHTLIKE